MSAEKLARAQIPSELLDRVPVRLAEAHHFLPLAVDDERRILSIVAAEPQNEKLLRDVAAIADVDEVYAYIALRSVVRAGIQKHYYADTTAFASLTSGPRASRADLAGIAAAYESAGSSKQASPPVPLRLRGESSQARTPAGRTSRPTTGESGLVAARGAVGETDYLETLRVLVDQLERSRGELRGHSAQLARQASLVAMRLGLPSREVSCVALAAFLHDLGKGPMHLTLAGTARNPEWKAEARKVALAPVHMFEAVHLPAQVGATLAQLYEAWDGSGTPQGAHGEDIAHRGADPRRGGQLARPHPEPGERLRPALHPRAGAQLHGRAGGDALRPPGGGDARAAPLGRAAPAPPGERRAAGAGRRPRAGAPRRGGARPGQEGAGGARHQHAGGRDGGGAGVGPVAVLGRALGVRGDRRRRRWSSARTRGWPGHRCW